MALWRRTRSEVAGAWRSVRYDFGRRPAEPQAGGPDVTSTGMYTFGGQFTDEAPTGGALRQPPRRAAAVTGFGALALAGAAGAYLAVVNVFGTHDKPAAAETFTHQQQPAVTATARRGLGSVPRTQRPVQRHEAEPDTTVTTLPPPIEAPAPPPVGVTKNPATVKSSECLCAPPVPTPTAPTASPSPTTESPSPSASASPSPSATRGGTSESPSPSVSPQGRRHHRR